MPLCLLLHTVRYLRPLQIVDRVWRRIHRPRVDRTPSAPVRLFAGVWQLPCERPSSLIAAQTFRLLNITGEVREAADWNDVRRGRLWCYNAHYFDDLNADGAVLRTLWHRTLIARWIAENPASEGAGWEPYPTSLRITNWIKWSVGCTARGEEGLDENARDSLAMQVRWLSQRLELHLLGNHIWANAKALTFAGVFFTGDEAGRWLRTGVELIERELDEQILPDGGHFERSPMYHAIVLEDVLDLLNCSRLAPQVLSPCLVVRLRSVAMRMHRWLRVMTHPDGRIAFFNDAAFSIAPEEVALAAYAERLGVQVNSDALLDIEALSDSGYVRLQNTRAVAICDVAPVGPDYLPGHAHADTLSFELSLDGRRVLVNSGTSTYERGAERQRQRGTAAHNTVMVDHLDSSEVWGGFRVARRARPLAVRWGNGDGTQWVEGAHDGYRRTVGCVTHRRRWMLDDGALTVDDWIEGEFRTAVAAMHIHPDFPIGNVDATLGEAVLKVPEGGTIRVRVLPAGSLSVEPSTWHSEFGLAKANVVLRLRFTGASLSTRVSW